MLALGIRYLQGVAVGSHGEHGRVEWPPHPARVFMAMVAAHYQTGAEATERAALRWLEESPPPEIHAPDAEPCRVVTQYVPVNDKVSASSKGSQCTRCRSRATDSERTFARASLASDTVVLHWPDAEPTPEGTRGVDGIVREGHAHRALEFTRADVARGCGSR